jgi:hypothetical protein
MTGRTLVLSALLVGLATAGVSAPGAWGAPATTAVTVATAGTYRYRQTSPVAVPPVEATLVIAPAASGNQTWTRNYGAKVPVSKTVMSYRNGGIFGLAQSEQMSGTTISCTFAVPLPWPPSPPTIGATFSGHSSCTNQAVLNVTGKIASTQVLQFEGKAVTTAVVNTTSVLAVTFLGARYEVDVTEVDWYAPALRMPLRTKIHTVVPSQSTTTDNTYVLESSTPS